MNRFMQTASALSLAVALASFPLIAGAQQATESEAEQALENVAQETGEAAGAAAEAVGEAAEAVGETLEQAGEATVNAAGEAITETEEAEVIVLEPTQGETTFEAVETTDTTEEAVETTDTAGEAVIVEGDAALQPMVEKVEGTIRMQDENSVLTSDLIGASVFNPADEKIGEIDDAILSLDGMVEGVVLGVGGFLGLGEKHVAIEMQRLSVQMDENGEPQLFLDTTKEALEAAPEFVTAEDQREEAARVETQVEPAGGLSTSDTAPATGVVPAPAPAGDAAAPVQN